jgi:molybdopterin-binding protein
LHPLLYNAVSAVTVKPEVRDMKISARNQFKGKIVSIEEGAVNGIVLIDIGGGNQVSATISMNAIKELELSVGKEAYAVIKATSVMVAID